MENNRSFYNEILTDHNLHPMHKHELADANMQLEGVNPSCGDDIILNLKVEDGKIVDGSFTGEGGCSGLRRCAMCAYTAVCRFAR